MLKSFFNANRLAFALLFSAVPSSFSPAGTNDIASCTLTPTIVYGTDTSAGVVTLVGPLPPGRHTVGLSSSNPAVVQVPSSVAVVSNVARFTATTSPVAGHTGVTITATYSNSTCQMLLSVRPPIPIGLTLNPNPVDGGDDSVATITINRPAAATFALDIHATLPAYFVSGFVVNFIPGATSTTKTVNTHAVLETVNALIIVDSPSSSAIVTSTLTVARTTRVASLTLAPASVTSGNASLGCVTLNTPAQAGGAAVVLSSSDLTVASVPTSLQIPEGDSDGCFLVQSRAIAECGSTVISATFGGQTRGATLQVGPIEQITDNADNDRWNARHSSTVDGNILWTNGDDVLFDNGISTQVIQARGGLDEVSPDALGLGTGSVQGAVIGAWRRGTDFAWVWRSGQAPVLVSAINPIDPKQIMNPQVFAIADGSVFVVMQAFFGGDAVKHVFRVDPVSGVASNLSGDLAVPGAPRVTTSGGQAAWLFFDDSANPKLQFFDGATVTDIDSGEIAETRVRMSRGRVVYEKVVAGVSHVYLYDNTLDEPAPVRLSEDADATRGNFAPATDGYHVAWLSGAANGTDLDVILHGGLQLNDSGHRPAALGFVEFPLQLQRGQMLWKDDQSQLAYATSGALETLCVTPATAFTAPWLGDGFVAGYGPQVGTAQTDNEVFIYPGLAPNDGDPPMPPFLLRATPRRDSVILEWDIVLGAETYSIYLADAAGVSKDNYLALPGGRAIGGITTSAARVCDLTGETPRFFVVTTLENSDEGAVSMEAIASADGNLAANLEDANLWLACITGPGDAGVPESCGAIDFAAADFNCDRRVDLADFAALSNVLSP